MQQGKSNWIIFKETPNFKLIYDSTVGFDPIYKEENPINYLIIYKALNKVEVVTHSIVNALSLLSMVEESYKTSITEELNTDMHDNESPPVKAH
jgi:hypothetical protein